MGLSLKNRGRRKEKWSFYYYVHEKYLHLHDTMVNKYIGTKRKYKKT